MLDVSVNPREFIAGINSITQNQLPWATMQALNETALAFQQAERGVMQSDFIIRRSWVTQGIKINRSDFARKDKLEARVIIDPARDFLGKFELGGAKLPRNGNRAISIPTGARRSAQSIVPDRLRPKNLEFKRVGTRGGTVIFKGDNRTFLIQRADGSGVILQRKGSKVAVKRRRHGALMRGQRQDFALVPLYVLKPRVRIKAQLHWTDTAKRTFADTFPNAMRKWWNEGVRTMKRPSGTAVSQGQALPAGWGTYT